MTTPTSRPPRPRLGHSLLELLVALPLAALLGTVAVALLLDAHHLTRRLESTTAQSRELRHAGEILTAEIRPLAADDIITWSDSALEFHSVEGSGILCASLSPRELDLLPLDDANTLRTAWFATPQSGDLVWTVARDSTPVADSATWQHATLSSATRAASSPCTALPLYTNGTNAGAPVRLTLASAPPRTPEFGTLVRITRRTRYSLYRASDGLWYLGRKSLETSGWTTIQPVAGPLASATHAGLRIAVLDSTNTAFATGAARTPRTVAIAMRSESQFLRAPGTPLVTDSLLIAVSLRGQSPSATP